jgi:hypothetical protein
MNKEQAYDAKIAPLMDQIVAACREHHIAMLATFAIPTPEDDGLSCTTHLPDETGKLPEHIKAAARAVRGPSPLMLTTRNAAGEVTKVTAVMP